MSTRVLAERAGLTPSVVHYHFSSLSALLNEAAISLMRQVLADMDFVLHTANTPADAVEAILASAEHYTGSDPMSQLAIEAYLAASRDEQLREQIASVVTDFRQRFGRWLGEHGVSAPEETAAVVVAAGDGPLLHRGLGAAPSPTRMSTVLRRLVDEGMTTEEHG